MGADTEIEIWKQLNNKFLYYRHAPRSKWGSERVKREQNEKDLKAQETYMKSKGFQFFDNKIITPSGDEEYAII